MLITANIAVYFNFVVLTDIVEISSVIPIIPLVYMDFYVNYNTRLL